MKMRRNLSFGLFCLLLGLALTLAGGSLRPASARVLAGFTPTPTATPTPTPVSTPAPTLTPPPSRGVSLQVRKEAQETIVPPGGTVVYSIVVENLGPEGATGVMIRDEVPSQLEVLEATVTQGEVTVEGNRVTAAVGVLGAGYSASLTITARVRPGTPPGTRIENVAVVWSDQTGEIPTRVTITVPGLLPETGVTGQGMAWIGVALAVVGAGALGLGLRSRAGAENAEAD